MPKKVDSEAMLCYLIYFVIKAFKFILKAEQSGLCDEQVKL